MTRTRSITTDATPQRNQLIVSTLIRSDWGLIRMLLNAHVTALASPKKYPIGVSSRRDGRGAGLTVEASRD